MNTSRQGLKHSKRVVIKVGTMSLVGKNGRPLLSRFRPLVASIADLMESGVEVVLVTSGAIGSGMQALGIRRRPREVALLQMAAAVGQARLMALYSGLFEEYGITTGQVLLTHDDLWRRTRHLNAKAAMTALLKARVLPIVNENDVVATDEIKVGDNDVLASLVALLLEADVLLLLSTTNGLMNVAPITAKASKQSLSQNSKNKNNMDLETQTLVEKSGRISLVTEINSDVLGMASGKGGELSTGGMATKLRATANALRGGVSVVIADGRKASSIKEVFTGKDVGTLFLPKIENKLNARKKWIGFFPKTLGRVIVDEGAALAMRTRGTSLLAAGVLRAEGVFLAGSIVAVDTEAGEPVARGLCEFSSEEIKRICGCRSSEIGKMLGRDTRPELIHRDNMVVI